MSKRAYIFVCLCFIVGSVFSQKPLPANETIVHDPVMIQENNTYYLFCTGKGISVFKSDDMKNWTRLNSVFDASPEWTETVVPGFDGHMWAPDVSYHNGQYYVYYSVSAFGKNTSAIGVVTNKTLDQESSDFKWVDHGIVIESHPNRDLWNAIDPNIIFDEEGTAWMSFGSFWGGLKLVKMNPDLLSIAEPQEWYTIARRERSLELEDSEAGTAALEAPFIFKKDDYYYLFLSWDFCCRGENSTYKVVVGRSKTVTGPYLDKEGKSLFEGGGSLVIEGNKNWYGVGHNSAYTFDGKDYFVCHAYDAEDNAAPKLTIKKMNWKNGWPTVKPMK